MGKQEGGRKMYNNNNNNNKNNNNNNIINESMIYKYIQKTLIYSTKPGKSTWCGTN